MSAIRRIGPSYDPLSGRASARTIVQALRATGLGATTAGAPLEVQPSDRPPRLETATPVEGESIAVRRVPDAPVVGFAAFLDGIQRSQVCAHRDGVPLVHGAVAAAVRRRIGRQLRTWDSPARHHALYLPFPLFEPEMLSALAAQCPVLDTLDATDTGEIPRHPGDLAARAMTAIQRRREREETALAERWVQSEVQPLLIDGGIATSELVARSPQVVGAVKSHRTLYVSGEALPLIFGLAEGERTTATVLPTPRRTPVATWYLRLRSPGSRGPLFGLVRVEVALEPVADITARADLVSRWLLAERSPVSLPDARWDVMVYGIHECEQYLSAILV